MPSGKMLEGGWQRLHPLSPVVSSARGLGALVIALFLLFVSHRGHSGHWDIYGDLIALGFVALASVISWAVTRWRVEGRTLILETGLLKRQSKRFPLQRVQAIDLVRPGTARALRLSEVRVRMGGSKGSDARLAYLGEVHAEAVRAKLLAISQRAQPEGPPPPEEVLFSQPTAILLAGLALYAPTLATLAALGAVIAVSVAVPGAEAALGGLIPVVGSFAFGLGRTLSNSWSFQLARSADGLRVRTGLVGRAAETIPAGRVQALRLVQPLFWRPFGWARLEADVSGRQSRKREDSDVAKQRRVLLPVAPMEVAMGVLGLVAPGAPESSGRTGRPPRRAMLKAPLSYHFLAASSDSRYAVASVGRIRRVTTWVPLAKAQSVRVARGPAQRWLGLADVWVDAAGRRSGCRMRDRGLCEANQSVVEMVDAAKVARHQDLALISAHPVRPADPAGP